ncbi:hypothetical protein G9A89_012039 [Geosiphon pyriformis]|nr:hypothetical protein G9A89_012039 [Geosiphon pyriformis]
MRKPSRSRLSSNEKIAKSVRSKSTSPINNLSFQKYSLQKIFFTILAVIISLIFSLNLLVQASPLTQNKKRAPLDQSSNEFNFQSPELSSDPLAFNNDLASDDKPFSSASSDSLGSIPDDTLAFNNNDLGSNTNPFGSASFDTTGLSQSATNLDSGNENPPLDPINLDQSTIPQPGEKQAFLQEIVPVIEKVAPEVIEEVAPHIKIPGWLPSWGTPVPGSTPPDGMIQDPNAIGKAGDGSDENGMILLNGKFDKDIRRFVEVAYFLEDAACISPSNTCLNHGNGNAARAQVVGKGQDQKLVVGFKSREMNSQEWNTRSNKMEPLRPSFGKNYPQGDQIVGKFKNPMADAGMANEFRGFFPKVAGSVKCNLNKSPATMGIVTVGKGLGGVYAGFAALEFTRMFGSSRVIGAYMFGAPNFLNWEGSRMFSTLMPNKIYRVTKPNQRISQSPGFDRGRAPILPEYYNTDAPIKNGQFNKVTGNGGGSTLYKCVWPPAGKPGPAAVNPNCSGAKDIQHGTSGHTPDEPQNQKYMDMPITGGKCKAATAALNSSTPEIASGDQGFDSDIASNDIENPTDETDSAFQDENTDSQLAFQDENTDSQLAFNDPEDSSNLAFADELSNNSNDDPALL